jgi:tRNA pseudouridine38-40 synthase
VVSRLLIEYDGGGFKGWARQPGLRTVQGEVETALAVLLREPVKLTVAGRTDAGTHAWGQVASYEGEPAAIRSLNALLPEDIAVLACEQAADGFNARFDALSRTYCYRLCTREARPAILHKHAWHWAWPFERSALDACASSLVGEHDFQAFTLSDEPYASYRRAVVRTMWLDQPGGLLEFWIEADSFTRRMVRALVEYQLEVARGMHSVEDFVSLLAGAPRSDGGGTAPATGLYLASVSYADDFSQAVRFGVAPA